MPQIENRLIDRSRRNFLRTSSAALMAGLFVPETAQPFAFGQEKPKSPNERPGIGAIGMRYQGSVITTKAQAHGDVVAICDVDRNVREQARAAYGSTPRIFEDYRELLARKEVDVVLIATPDHWHAKMVIDACRAGKDVYIEKPLTLTVDEGRLIARAVKETGRVVQVGSWHRSDENFRLAVELVREGRIGQLQKVEVVLGKNVVGGPFARRPVPAALNWNLWQGQTPDVPYIEERSHYTFRWWLEYSGGQLTDWGAHHVDIAQWAINSDPVSIGGTAKFPTVKDGYNVPIDFQVQYRFANGVEMTVADEGRNGIMFTGSEGRLFVNRGTLSGKPVEDLAGKAFPREKFKLYAHDNHSRPARTGKLDAIINHMGNFFDCIRTRHQPLSEVESQRRSVNTCHLGNISLRLGRTLTWDAARGEFTNDAEANRMLRREQRKGFEVV